MQWDTCPYIDKQYALYFIIYSLNHWDRMTHLCVNKLTSIGLDNGLSPGWCQAIVRSNTGMIVPVGTDVSELSIEVHTLSFKKMHLNMTSGKWRSLCLIINVLNSAFFFNMGRKFRGIGPTVGTVIVFLFLISLASDDLEDYFSHKWNHSRLPTVFPSSISISRCHKLKCLVVMCLLSTWNKTLVICIHSNVDIRNKIRGWQLQW